MNKHEADPLTDKYIAASEILVKVAKIQEVEFENFGKIGE